MAKDKNDKNLFTPANEHHKSAKKLRQEKKAENIAAANADAKKAVEEGVETVNFKVGYSKERSQKINAAISNALEELQKDYNQLDPELVPNELPDERVVIHLAKQGLADLREVAQGAAPGVVASVFKAIFKLGAAGIIGLDAMAGALNNTTPDKERDFSSPSARSKGGSRSP